jgi:hypothetical protein
MTTKTPEPWETEIKELYKKMLKIQEVNTPDKYIMPVEVYNIIMKKIVYLERALENARQSRDNWRSRVEEKKC